jgi:hypothetical protein
LLIGLFATPYRWIHGVASDSVKTAEFRAILRLRRHMSDHYQDAPFVNFSRLLLKARGAAVQGIAMLCCLYFLVVADPPCKTRRQQKGTDARQAHGG